MRSESSFAYLGVKKNFSVSTIKYSAVFGLKVQWQAGIWDAKAVLTVKTAANPTTTRTTRRGATPSWLMHEHRYQMYEGGRH